MNVTAKVTGLSAVLAGAAVVLSACGGAASGSTVGSAGAAGDPAAPVHGAGLHVATTSLGRVLVDAQGRTVYLLTADGRNMSTCGSDCQSFWPAVTAGHSKLGVPVATTRTPAGTSTATVAGQPVYAFANDHAAGDVNGEGLKEFGGTWYAVSPTGQAVTGTGSSSGTSTGGSAPYGGGY